MPIHINLFSEAQAAEDLRRRDPAKRAIIGAALLLALLLVWSSSLQLKAMLANSRLAGVQTEIELHTNEFQHVLVSIQKVAGTREKMAALQKLSNCRFLQGTLLNALQQATLQDVQLTRIRVDQLYAGTEAIKPATTSDHKTPGHPATITEKIMLSLDARDFSNNPGDQVNKFKDVINHQPYFEANLDKTNAIRLVGLSPAQAGVDGKLYVLFTIECHYPDQTR